MGRTRTKYYYRLNLGSIHLSLYYEIAKIHLTLACGMAIIYNMANTYSITSKYQITLPKEIRNLLGVQAKDQLKFESDGKRVYLEKALSVSDIQHMNNRLLRQRRIKPASDEDIKNARDKYLQTDRRW